MINWISETTLYNDGGMYFPHFFSESIVKLNKSFPRKVIFHIFNSRYICITQHYIHTQKKHVDAYTEHTPTAVSRGRHCAPYILNCSIRNSNASSRPGCVTISNRSSTSSSGCRYDSGSDHPIAVLHRGRFFHRS